MPVISQFVPVTGGLRLHARINGPEQPRGYPIVCLPGLSRTTADFDDLSDGLARKGRRVIALDSRGRGRSDYDPDPSHYSLPVELGDAISVMTTLSVSPAVIVGTSRGGLLAMLLGVVHPDMIAGVVLNDIGPEIEPKGLLRIKASLGKLPPPNSFVEGAELLRRLHSAQFRKLTDAQWLAFAHRTWRSEGGSLVPTYDPALASALGAIDPQRPLPNLWKEFDSLAGKPVMVIRGETSDILTAETVARMQARHPALVVLDVPDQGHTPLLAEQDVIDRIAAFAESCDTRSPN